ncbi:MAG TPA: hypothetical protein VHX66_17820 [Solirubrobacteraceae bacterium]|nr:hypothetical protein [Solirubrobacteraceae bacterium]
MSTAAPRQRPARTTPGPLLRTWRSWRALGREQRLTAFAALALWITMFLPWYSQSPAGAIHKNETAVSSTLTAWSAFSWVEAAVLLVSFAVLALLFARGERRGFHLPGGDGFAVSVAGGLATVLILYRMLDKSSQKVANVVITSGNEWGIFLALFAAIWLTWTGINMRRAHRAEPALAEDASGGAAGERERPLRRVPAAATAAGSRDRRPRGEDEPRLEHRGVRREDAEQLSFELPDDRGER